MGEGQGKGVGGRAGATASRGAWKGAVREQAGEGARAKVGGGEEAGGRVGVEGGAEGGAEAQQSLLSRSGVPLVVPPLLRSRIRSAPSSACCATRSGRSFQPRFSVFKPKLQFSSQSLNLKVEILNPESQPYDHDFNLHAQPSKPSLRMQAAMTSLVSDGCGGNFFFFVLFFFSQEDEIPDRVRKLHEARLEELQRQLTAHRKKEAERKMVLRYKGVRFFGEGGARHRRALLFFASHCLSLSFFFPPFFQCSAPLDQTSGAEHLFPFSFLFFPSPCVAAQG